MDTHARIYTRLDTTSDHESNRMVTVSFDFSQIPAQWVARNSCGKKVVKSVGRGGRVSSSSKEGSLREISPHGQGGLVLFFEICLPFCQFSHLFTERKGGGSHLLLGTYSCLGNPLEGGKISVAGQVSMLIYSRWKRILRRHAFWIEDQSGTTSVNCFEARIL